MYKVSLTEKNILAKLYQLSKSKFPNLSENERRICVRQCYEDEENKKIFYKLDPPPGHTEKTRNNIENSFGILSLTSNNNNYLMWSHYADSHNGICLGFDTKLLFKSIFRDDLESANNFVSDLKQYYISDKGGIKKVIYQKELPKFSLQEELLSFIQKTLYTKSHIWKYENEYRLLKIGVAQHKVKIPKECILSITLGCSMKSDHKKDFIEIIKKTLPKTIIYETTIHKKKFQLDIKQIY